MKSKNAVLEEKTFKVRFLSMLLVVMIVFMSIPSIDIVNVNATESSSNNLVLTNASVEFKDFSRVNDAENPIESGVEFYLYISVSGNNTEENGKESFCIYITDNNLLLENFEGDGFTDGAEYNGYTLHVVTDSDGNITSRYIEFSVSNGKTENIWLQVMFANGTTPNGDKATVKVQSLSTGKYLENSIEVVSDTEWKTSKTVDQSEVSGNDIINNDDGVILEYTLNASSETDDTGAWWLESLEFTDTITLPDGITIKDAQSAVEIAGLSSDDYTVTADGNTLTITWTVDNENPNTDLENQQFTLYLNLNNDTVDVSEDFSGGTVSNEFGGHGTRYNENDTGYDLSTASADTTVNPITDAEFTVSKSVQNGKSYYISGDTITYVISVTNRGGKTGNITVNEVPSDGLTITGITSSDGEVSLTDNTITFKDVAAGATVYAYVTATVDIDYDTTLTNDVTDDDDNILDTEYITVRKDEPNLTVSKTGDVVYTNGDYTKDLGNNYLVDNGEVVDGQTAYFTIIVTNDGTQDLTNIEVDETSIGLSNLKLVDSSVTTTNGNTATITYSDGVLTISSLEADDTIIIELTASIDSTAGASNIASIPDYDTEDEVEMKTATPLLNMIPIVITT